MKPLLYSIVEEQTLHTMLDTFYACIRLPIQAIDENGEFLSISGSINNFCNCFQKYLPAGDTCDKMHVNAAKRAVDLGEPYIFSCHADLCHIVFPLINNQTFLGSILVGPFLMDEPDSLLVSGISKHYHISTEESLELYDEIREIPVIPPAMVNHISRLLYFLFSNLIDEGKKLLKYNNQKLIQQSRINESIQRYKFVESNTNTYPYELEQELMTKARLGDSQNANALLTELLGYVFFSEGNSLEVVKSRAVELCSLLSRSAIEGGAPTDSILKLNNEFLKNIQQITTLESLCFKLQEIVETFSTTMFHSIPSKNGDLIKKSILYISQNFNRRITLDETAEHVHLNPSYFSTLFKQSTGSSFKEYLNMVRVEESKRLLSNTDFSIIDIAVAVGFDDQSYFSKVFKKYTGITPKQYR